MDLAMTHGPRALDHGTNDAIKININIYIFWARKVKPRCWLGSWNNLFSRSMDLIGMKKYQYIRKI